VYSSVLEKFDEVVILMATSGSPGWTLTLYILAITFHPLFKEFRHMKKILLRGALAVAVVLGGATAYAQMGAQAGGAEHGQHQPMSADQRLQMLTQQLNLTSDQQSQIKPILESQSQQMESLRSDSSLSQQDRMSKMKEIRESTNSQIKPILTPDQQTKWQQMMEQRGKRSGAPRPVPQ
jgi:Spy/CpxP family protein refolding chaperone